MFNPRQKQCTKEVLKEVDFVHELWNMLLLRRISSKYFLSNGSGNFNVLEEYKLEDNCMKFGKNYVFDLISDCSECRKKLLSIERFVLDNRRKNDNSSVIFDGRSSPFQSVCLLTTVQMLLRPIVSLLRKFLEDMDAKTQRHMIQLRDLSGFSSYFVGFKPEVEKVFNFFRPLLSSSQTYSAGNLIISPKEVTPEDIDNVWNKFVIGLNTSSDLSEELPIWQKLYKEMLSLLGEYFDDICRQELFNDPVQPFIATAGALYRSCSAHSLSDNNNVPPSFGTQKECHDSCDSLSCYSKDNSNCVPPSSNHHSAAADNQHFSFSQKRLFFACLFTQKVAANLQQAAHFSEKLSIASKRPLLSHTFASSCSLMTASAPVIHRNNGSTAADAVPQAFSFQRIFDDLVKKTARDEKGNPFKHVINLLEEASFIYKSQYTDFIFYGVRSGCKLNKTLAELKLLYTLRPFIPYISTFSDEVLEKEHSKTVADWSTTLNMALADFLEKNARHASTAKTVKNDFKNGKDIKPSLILEDEDAETEAAKNEWKVLMNSDISVMPWKFRLSYNLEWPLSCVFGEDVMEALESCLERCQTLYHMYMTAYALSQNRVTVKKSAYMRSTYDRKRRQLLARRLLESITILYSVVRQYMETLIDKYCGRILASPTLTDMDRHVTELTNELRMTLGPDAYLFPAVESLCSLIAEFRCLEEKCLLKNNHCDAANFSANLSSETPALLLVTTSRGSDFVTDANCPATTAFNRSINNGNSSSLTNEFESEKIERFLRKLDSVRGMFANAFGDAFSLDATLAALSPGSVNTR